MFLHVAIVLQRKEGEKGKNKTLHVATCISELFQKLSNKQASEVKGLKASLFCDYFCILKEPHSKI